MPVATQTTRSQVSAIKSVYSLESIISDTAQKSAVGYIVIYEAWDSGGKYQILTPQELSLWQERRISSFILRKLDGAMCFFPAIDPGQ